MGVGVGVRVGVGERNGISRFTVLSVGDIMLKVDV